MFPQPTITTLVYLYPDQCNSLLTDSAAFYAFVYSLFHEDIKVALLKYESAYSSFLGNLQKLPISLKKKNLKLLKYCTSHSRTCCPSVLCSSTLTPLLMMLQKHQPPGYSSDTPSMISSCLVLLFQLPEILLPYILCVQLLLVLWVSSQKFFM